MTCITSLAILVTSAAMAHAQTGATDVRARTSGTVEKIHVKLGAAVKKGDLLVGFDPRPSTLKLAEAEARVRETNARLQQAKASLDRAARLFAVKAISKEEYDRVMADHAVAEINRTVASNALELAALQVERSQILAPVNGTLSKINIQLGDLVKENQICLVID